MSLSREPLRRRKAIRSWIPAAVLLVLIVAALSVAVMTRTTNVGAAPTSAPPTAVTAEGTSLFTPAGLAYINDTRKVSIDARQLPIEVEPLGLEASGTLTIAPPTEAYEYLTVIGPGGGTRLMGTTIDIVTEDGYVTAASITDSLRPLNYRETQALFRERVERFAIPPERLDGFASAAADARRDNRDFTYSIRTDDALGVGLTVTAECSSDSVCGVVDRFEFN
ncbi:MAG TPA: hypothetical protein VEX88_00890 [Glaciibacter sp.]|nr:hypothetical protein [Glaciibacter sp.]